MSYTILIPQPISETGILYLDERGYTLKKGQGFTEDDIVRDIADADGLLIRNARITRRIIDAALKLKVIGRHGVGLDTIDVDYATQKGIQVTNAPLSNTNAVAEHTLLLILACAKHLVEIVTAFKGGDFDIRHRIKNIELRGKILGVVGCGRIGKLVAKSAYCGLGMKTIGYDPYIQKEALQDFTEITTNLEYLFSECDFITLHLPVTPETNKMIDKRYLSRMKKTAFLINAARAEILNEMDVIKALEDNSIAGLAIDVFDKEPPDMSSPLFKLSNVLSTPHNAAHTHEAFENMALHAAQGIHEVLSGKTPTWSANKIQ
jgi:D-3-phosphoglycerate dehydrogenase